MKRCYTLLADGPDSHCMTFKGVVFSGLASLNEIDYDIAVSPGEQEIKVYFLI